MKDVEQSLFAAFVLASIAALSLAVPACGDEETAPAQIPDAGVEAAAPPSPPPEIPPSDGGGGVIIEVDCPVGTAVELEDNNAPEAANEFDQLAYCGAISPGADVDYSKFKTPAGKKLVLFQGVIEGAVDFDLLVNGKTLKPAEVKKFEAGEYVVKAYTKDAKPGKYRYRIQFEP
jgi:hypothetical protein